MNQWVIKPLIPPVNHQKDTRTADFERENENLLDGLNDSAKSIEKSVNGENDENYLTKI